MFTPYLLLDFIYKFTAMYKEETDIKYTIESVLAEIVQARKQHAKQLQLEPEDVFKPQLFIDQLLLSDKLQDDEILHEARTMVAAGSETTALTVANAVLLLAMFPETQAKLAKEADDFWLAHGDEKIDAENFNQLIYLDMVIKETLRLMTSVPIIARTTHSDFDLGPLVVKPGVFVWINIFSLHRSPKYWGEDAEQFRPERFAPECADKINLNAFIPFSAGARNCVGECICDFTF
jgi:cytochrome P450